MYVCMHAHIYLCASVTGCIHVRVYVGADSDARVDVQPDVDLDDSCRYIHSMYGCMHACIPRTLSARCEKRMAGIEAAA